MKRTGVTIALVGLAWAACSSAVTLSVPPVERVGPTPLRPPVRVTVGGVAGDECFRREIGEYLAGSAVLRVAAPGENPDLSLSGELQRIEVHSNRGDKEVAILYFSAFVVTAPLALLVYLTQEWRADAAAEGVLAAVDPDGRRVWSRALTVSVAETQRALPSREALNAAMHAAVCRKLATTLLNALAAERAGQ